MNTNKNENYIIIAEKNLIAEFVFHLFVFRPRLGVHSVLEP